MTVHHDDLGTKVLLDRSPRRLVSLVPNLTETLWQWGLADHVVGRTTWCVAPAGGFPEATTVRGTKNPDVAAIVALTPDLVIANEEENRRLDVDQLRAAGVPVWVTRVRTVQDAARSLARLAAALGVAAEGRRLATALEAAASTPPGGEALRAFVPIWRGLPPLEGRDDETWMAVGSATIGADILATGGFAVWPDDDPTARYPRVGLDEVLKAPLDVVLLTDEPYEFTDDDRPDLPQVPIHALDGADLFWWGPRTPAAVAALRRLATRLRSAASDQ